MMSAKDGAHSYMLSERETEQGAGHNVGSWTRKVTNIARTNHTGEYWVAFDGGSGDIDGGSEGLIMPSFRNVLAQLAQDSRAGVMVMPCIMQGRSLKCRDSNNTEVVTDLRAVKPRPVVDQRDTREREEDKEASSAGGSSNSKGRAYSFCAPVSGFVVGQKVLAWHQTNSWSSAVVSVVRDDASTCSTGSMVTRRTASSRAPTCAQASTTACNTPTVR